MKRDASRHYWFKRRRYGYGWTPATWQGWLTVVLFLAMVILGAIITIGEAPKNTVTPELIAYLVMLVIGVTLVVVISLKKGPKPKWRWGKKTTDNPNEDF